MTATWTAPKTWADNELVTAALLNTHLRDNLEFLKQLTNVVIIEDQQAQGTAGGTFTTGDWRTRNLNTIVADPGSYVTNPITSNQFQLAAGTWLCIASAPAYQVLRHQARLQNITDSTTLLIGTSAYSHTSDVVVTRSWIVGTFTLSAAKTLQIQHQCGASGSFGQGANFTTEVFTTVMLIKIG